VFPGETQVLYSYRNICASDRQCLRPTDNSRILSPHPFGDYLMSTLDRLCYPVPDAAEAVGIGQAYLYQLIRTKQLPIVRLGRRTLIRREDLVALIESRRTDMLSKEPASVETMRRRRAQARAEAEKATPESSVRRRRKAKSEPQAAA
jgi:excisionase family DNA binding protein